MANKGGRRVTPVFSDGRANGFVFTGENKGGERVTLLDDRGIEISITGGGGTGGGDTIISANYNNTSKSITIVTDVQTWVINLSSLSNELQTQIDDIVTGGYVKDIAIDTSTNTVTFTKNDGTIFDFTGGMSESEKLSYEKNHSENTLTNIITLTTGNDEIAKVYNQNKIDTELNNIAVEQTSQNDRLDILEANPGTGLPSYAGIHLNGIVRIPPILSSTPSKSKFEDSDNEYFTATLNVGDYTDFKFKETGIYKIEVVANGSAENSNSSLTSVIWKNNVLSTGSSYLSEAGDFSVIYEFVINVTNINDVYNFGAYDDGAGSVTITDFFSITSKQSEAIKNYVTTSQFTLSQGVQDLKINTNETNITNNANDIISLETRLTDEESKTSDVISSDDKTFTFINKNGIIGKSWTIPSGGFTFNDLGDFPTLADLPTTGSIGDVANVTSETDPGLNGLYYWSGSGWTKFEVTVDLSNYYTKPEIDNFVTALENKDSQIENILTKAVADILVLDYAMVQVNNKVNSNTSQISQNANDIISLQNKDIDLQAQIDTIVDTRIFNYVVPTFADLPATATEGEIALVLSDVNYSDTLTYYKWTGGAWVYQANYVKDYYTKSEIDAQQLAQDTNISNNTNELINKANANFDNIDVGISTSGQILAVNSTADGVEFIDLNAGGISKTYDLNPFGSDTQDFPVTDGASGTVQFELNTMDNEYFTVTPTSITPKDGIALSIHYNYTIYTITSDFISYAPKLKLSNSTYDYAPLDLVTAESTFNVDGVHTFSKSDLFSWCFPTVYYKDVVGNGTIKIRINTLTIEAKEIM